MRVISLLNTTILLVLLFTSTAFAADLNTKNTPSNSTDMQATEMQAGSGSDAAVSAGTAEAVDVELAEADEAEESKWWSLSLSYTLSHNLARERPTVTNSFSVAPQFTLPYDIGLGLGFGFYVNTAYPSGVLGGSDVTFNTVDTTPLSLTLSKSFAIDPERSGFAISTSLTQLFPFTSKFSLEKKWYYAIKPGLGLSLSKWGFSLGYSLSGQKNFHGQDYAMYRDTYGSTSPIPINEWSLSMSGSLSYNVWKMNFAVSAGWSTAWRYNTSTMETPNNSMNYSASAGIEAYDGLNIGLGVSTGGPERIYGGFKNDYLIPLDPRFTEVYLSLTYTI